ncbi:MAG TPA: DUF2378 family protein [Myxococcaceae bacterium]|nr:DUF2378 family protein [Myxococcaceae bacterium]
MQQKLVFDQTLEGLFIRGLSGQVTAGLKGQLRGVGVDLDRKLLPAYPFSTWCSCVAVVARELYGREPPEVAYRLLGERMVDGYRATVWGRSLFSVLQLLGPRRVIGRAQQSFRSGNNYTEIRTRELGPQCRELWVNEEGLTRHLMQGALLAGLRGSGAREPRVELKSFTPQDVTFHVMWEEDPA